MREVCSLKTTHKKKRQREEREEFVLFDSERRRRVFPLLRDADLGLERKFQSLVHPSSHDDDCETDEEQLECSRLFCHTQLREGIVREFGAGAIDPPPSSPHSHNGHSSHDSESSRDD